MALRQAGVSSRQATPARGGKNVLPVIKRNQRCGHCQTCLNPRVRALTCSLPTNQRWNRSTGGTSSRRGQCWGEQRCMLPLFLRKQRSGTARPAGACG